MPPLILWAAAAIGGSVIARFAIREAKRINAELEEARLSRVAERARDGHPRKLRLDPNTGTYRPE